LKPAIAALAAARKKAGVKQDHDSNLNHGRTLPNLAGKAGVSAEKPVVPNLAQREKTRDVLADKAGLDRAD